MISTNTVRAKLNGGPQRLMTLTTNKVKPKTEADVLAAATATRDALRGRVRNFETRKYTGPMLTVSNMADRVVNEKRKALMMKVKTIKFKAKTMGSIRVEHVEAMPHTPAIVIEPDKKRRGRPKKEK